MAENETRKFRVEVLGSPVRIRPRFIRARSAVEANDIAQEGWRTILSEYRCRHAQILVEELADAR